MVGKIIERLAEMNYYSARAFYKYKLRQSCLKYTNAPLLVYQMGKVGSETVASSLSVLKLDMPIYHVHYLSESLVSETEENRRKYFHTEKYHLLKRPWLYQFLQGEISKGLEGRRWKIITLTREPVARNLSAFFENIEFKPVGVNNGYEIKSDYYGIEPTIVTIDDLSKLMDLFFDRLKHDAPLVFFDRELKGVFDIDVFSSEFPISKGYAIYEGNKADVLLIRLENLNECAQDAFKEFLNIDNFTLINTNTAAEKTYDPVYRKFKNNIALPDSYIDKLYNSKYMRHFYSKAETEEFRKRWRRT